MPLFMNCPVWNVAYPGALGSFAYGAGDPVQRIYDTVAGDPVTFHHVESSSDLAEVREFVRDHRTLAFDTEATGINCYRPDWRLRTFQVGNPHASFVIPARYSKFIGWTMRQPINWIGHNGPHDVRSVDAHLGYDTGVVCRGETYIPAHHYDSRKKQEGGTGHGLKELSIAHVDSEAGKWEAELKRVFKTIMVRIPGEFYKSGKRKGEPKFRKARMDEGWSLIDPEHPAYVAYAASDPVLTYRLWLWLQRTYRRHQELYEFDHKVQMVCDTLQRRAIRLDVPYTKRLSAAYLRKANKMQDRAAAYGCSNIQSTAQIADVLIELGAELTERTDTGKFKVDGKVLRGLLDNPYTNAKIKDFIHSVLLAKQLLKRRSSYTEAMLRERDINDRVHTSINSLAARTARMSASNPPFQQLPTKDREDEVMWESEEAL